jgi:NAD(P)-dependent dehydrogenase (short-subunit alcohol dehydrogenase family)
VTGSSRGLGLALARAFAAEGAALVLSGRDPRALESARDALSSSLPGARVEACAADVSTPGGADTLVRTACDALGGLDLLVNNAALGGPPRIALWQAPPDEIDAVLRTNLGGALHCSAAAIRAAEQSGRSLRIVNVSSGIAGHSHAGLGAYAISKTALEALSDALVAEVASASVPITIVTVRPPSLRTGMTKAHFSADRWAQLPPPESAVALFLRAATAPHEAVHGRVLSE